MLARLVADADEARPESDIAWLVDGAKPGALVAVRRLHRPETVWGCRARPRHDGVLARRCARGSGVSRLGQWRRWRRRFEEMVEAVGTTSPSRRALAAKRFATNDGAFGVAARNVTILGEGSAQCRTMCALGAPGIRWSALRMARREFADDILGLGLALLKKTTHDDLPELLPLLPARGRKED